MDDINPTEAHEELMRQLEEMPADVREKLQNVLDLLRNELVFSATKETEELLFCGADKDKVVKCLHFPSEVLNWEDGPILLPSANPNVILGAVSNELVHRKVEEFSRRYEEGLERESRWEIYLNSIALRIAELHDQEGGFDFSDLLA